MKPALPAPLRGLLDHLRTSLWFLPSVLLAGAGGLALLMLWVDRVVQPALPAALRFDAGPAAARTVLSTIAGSMVTVAGVVFSIAIVVLTLAASQYSPRVIRNFMRDRLSQLVLGVFAGVFVYCLLVLGAVEGDGNGGGGWVPRLATSVGMASALAAIVLLVLYIHHIARAIQAVHILAAAAAETFAAVDTLFPEGLGEEPPVGAAPPDLGGPPAALVAAHRTGYLQRVDVERLLRLAAAAGAVLELRCQVGDFVVEGEPLAAVHGSADPRLLRGVPRAFAVGRFQTVEQDPGFGLREIVDVGLRALSPALNDETSAAEAIDYVGAVLARLAARPEPARERYHHGACRVVVRAPRFSWLLELGFRQLVRVGAASPETLQRVLAALERVAGQAKGPDRCQAVAAMAGRVRRAASGIADPGDRERVVALARALQQRLARNLT